MIENPEAGVSPCEHTLFIYIGMVGGFEYQSSDFSQRLEIIPPEEADFDFEVFKETLAKLGYGHDTLALEITYGGMTCGPSWFTDVYGFRFA